MLKRHSKTANICVDNIYIYTLPMICRNIQRINQRYPRYLDLFYLFCPARSMRFGSWCLCNVHWSLLVYPGTTPPQRRSSTGALPPSVTRYLRSGDLPARLGGRLCWMWRGWADWCTTIHHLVSWSLLCNGGSILDMKVGNGVVVTLGGTELAEDNVTSSLQVSLVKDVNGKGKRQNSDSRLGIFFLLSLWEECELRRSVSFDLLFLIFLVWCSFKIFQRHCSCTPNVCSRSAIRTPPNHDLGKLEHIEEDLTLELAKRRQRLHVLNLLAVCFQFSMLKTVAFYSKFVSQKWTAGC